MRSKQREAIKLHMRDTAHVRLWARHEGIKWPPLDGDHEDGKRERRRPRVTCRSTL